MFPRIRAIAGNTLSETLRQPVFGVVLLAALGLIALSPAFTMFSLVNHIRLVKDMGLATLLVAGFLLAVLAATAVITEEIRKQTVLTVVSKPVGRFEFILGKYLGIFAALAIAGYLMILTLAMTCRVGVPAAVTTPLDVGAIIGLLAAFSLALLGALVANYLLDRPFPSTAILLGVLTFTLAFVIVGFLPPVAESLKLITFHYDFSIILAGALILPALEVLAAVAVAASTRLNPLLTLGVCAVFFGIGLAGDYALGRLAVSSVPADLVYRMMFNIQIFSLADAASAGREIPWHYIGRAALYAVTYQAAALSAAFLLFESREVAR
ncbi:MAG: hypothetical protein HYU36_18045 [Planctomycetes bacterium]|nr:hypothetical protein [Planctomycetota bacterium]